MPIPDELRSAAEVGGWTIGAAVAGLWARSSFLRRWSRDKVVSAYDQTEVSLLNRAIAKADELEVKASTAYRERDEALRKVADTMLEVGQLRTRVELLTSDVDRLTARLEFMQRTIENLTNRDLGHGRVEA